MIGNIGHARDAIRRCRELREGSAIEAVLRAEFHSRLRLMFGTPADESWINHYGEGAEALTKIGTAAGAVASRFIDNLVGSTTIEYEADLRIPAKRDEGLHQVREHIAGLVRAGIPIAQVRGILSDTVDWFAYDATLATGVEPSSCSISDITLVPVDSLEIALDDEPSAERLLAFVRKHLAREQSRPLKAAYLTLDLGLDSKPHARSADALQALVEAGRHADSSAVIATDLWSKFVDYLEGGGGPFRSSGYVDEVYLSIVGRLLSANVLAGQAMFSDDAELRLILNGAHFREKYQLANMVEQDYFGWLVTPHHVDELVPIAREIQHDLYAYDYSWQPEEDLFGRLMAQLSRRSQRKLLGQEWTPAWLSRLLAKRCIGMIPSSEMPRIIDMCCGSGAILAEVLKVTREDRGLTGIEALCEVATGFDIDPLAVSLAKTTWVVTLAAEIKSATSPVVIPIYNADSLFAVTPVSAALPFLDESETIEISLDGTSIKIPSAIVSPEYRELFDRIVDWAYDEALDAQASGSTTHLTETQAATFLDGAAAAVGMKIPAKISAALAPAAAALARRMAELAIAGRNGIWAFILRNTYRPGLLSGQFNGLVSNPPWLALSGLADNPYRDVLTNRAKLYGIRPTGQSFLHLELGTTHLLHAVDRYLASNAAVACLIPGTVFNGHHHEPFRQRSFLTSKRPVALQIDEMWQVQPGTFKYPGAAIVGRKKAKPAAVKAATLSGFVARDAGLEATEFSTRSIGSRTAWLLEKEGLPALATPDAVIPQQGADLMPRAAVCVEILNASGTESRVATPTAGTPFGFTVKAAKELKGQRFFGHVAPRFIFRMAQSENLLPFVLGEHRVAIALPASKESTGAWQLHDEAEIRTMGFVETARWFRAINAKLTDIGQGQSLQQRIDLRGKLSKQVFGKTGFLVLTGAGGKHICSACLPIADCADLVVDQTLYWQVVDSADEAWYRVGMLNSLALTEAITPFNPKGAFKERHIHSLPYRLMPAFHHGNEDHVKIAALAQTAAVAAKTMVTSDAYLRDPANGLVQRRSKLRAALKSHAAISEIELLCAAALGASAAEDEATPASGEE